MEVWEVAAALGEATGAVENRLDGAGGAVQSGGRDLVAERVRAHREGRPPPEPEPMSVGQLTMIQERLRVS